MSKLNNKGIPGAMATAVASAGFAFLAMRFKRHGVRPSISWRRCLRQSFDNGSLLEL